MMAELRMGKMMCSGSSTVHLRSNNECRFIFILLIVRYSTVHLRQNHANFEMLR